MGENANAPYVGDLQYLLQGAAAPGIVTGGTVTVDPGILTDPALGGRLVVQGGIAKASFEAELQEPLKALMSGMIRSSVGAKTVTPKTFTAGTNDHEFTFTDCQPRGFRYSCQPDQLPRLTAGFWSLTPSITEVGDSQIAVSGGIDEEWSGFDVLVDSVDFGCQGFEVGYECNPMWDATLGQGDRLPGGVYLQTPAIECVLRLEKRITGGPAGLLGAISKSHAVVIASTDVTFSLSGLITPRLEHAAREANGVLVYQYRFTSSTPYGGLSVT